MTKLRKAASSKASRQKHHNGPPAPFKTPADVLNPLIETLDEQHIYILHIDRKPAAFKRKIFLVPCAMNICIVLLFAWRIYAVVPWYLQILASTLGTANETTFVAAELEWPELTRVVATRGLNFFFDLLLFIFVWPWPVEFATGQKHGNPVNWRWNVGFRDKEVVCRRSRGGWDKQVKDMLKNQSHMQVFMTNVGMATAPMYIEEKTGYMMMDKNWDLDWGVMVDATMMVDKKMAALEAFQLVVLVFSDEYGWMSVDMKTGNASSQEDQRRRQVFAFRDALAAVGKEDLFYHWIEIIQMETDKKDGFGPERQAEVAKEIRDMFQKEGIDFDKFWKDSVGSEGLAGM